MKLNNNINEKKAQQNNTGKEIKHFNLCKILNLWVILSIKFEIIPY